MARRIPLPRLTRRQRLARWQRERRQQVIYVAGFSIVLLFAFGLVAWAAASRHYDDNLKPAVRVAGRSLPMRDVNRRFTYERDRFFLESGITAAQESSPQLRSFVRDLHKTALDGLVLAAVLEEVAREEGSLPSPEEVQARVDRDFAELHVRHVLVSASADEKDKQKADADAKAKAEAIAAQLRADPLNDELWKEVAAKESGDPGTKEKGGDLGWVNGSSGFVKEFEEAMYALADGQISDPVQSSFGYHLIQRLETRAANRTPLFARLRRDGLALEDLQAVARANLLKDRYEQRAREADIASPQEQVRLAVIRVRLGPPTQMETYLAALQKLNLVRDKIDKGEDFAELAKKESDDADTREKGGELGWVARAMLPDEVADDVFAREVGQRSDQHETATNEISIFKVLEKATREVTEEQKAKIRAQAFDRWRAEQERRLGVERLAEP